MIYRFKKEQNMELKTDKVIYHVETFEDAKDLVRKIERVLE